MRPRTPSPPSPTPRSAAELSPEQLQQLVGLVEYDASRDPFPVTGWDAVVFVVGNATQTAHFYQSAYGMELVGYSGPETGNRDHKAFVLKSGSCRFVIKGGVAPDSPLLDHHRAHGDGVIDIALEVPDVDALHRPRAQHRRPRRAGAERPHRRARHRAGRVHRGVRRHRPLARRPLALRRASTCPATSSARPATSSATARRSGSSRRSTTWSATSSSATWTSGSASTTRSWAS